MGALLDDDDDDDDDDTGRIVGILRDLRSIGADLQSPECFSLFSFNSLFMAS